jgi:cytidylate kinase
VIIDSTDHTVEQVVDEILRLVEAARARRPR